MDMRQTAVRRPVMPSSEMVGENFSALNYLYNFAVL